jgi:hypothetical protein
MLLTLRKLPVIGLSFVHIITSNMRDIHTERSDNLLLTFYHRGLLRFFFHSTLKKTREESQMSNCHTTLFQNSFVSVS